MSQVSLSNTRGRSRIFLGGGALVSCSTSIPINHIVFFFCRIPVVGGGEGTHPLHSPPRVVTRMDTPKSGIRSETGTE